MYISGYGSYGSYLAVLVATLAFSERRQKSERSRIMRKDHSTVQLPWAKRFYSLVGVGSTPFRNPFLSRVRCGTGDNQSLMNRREGRGSRGAALPHTGWTQKNCLWMAS